ncbi:MAG: hypothetical protein R6V84_18330 [Desulfobacterales bacterium]
MNHSSHQRMFSWVCMRSAGVAVLSAAALVLGGCGGSSSSGPIEANIDELVVQIGGATTAVEYYNDGEKDWVLYSMANRFAARVVNAVQDEPVTEITVPGFIQNITVVSYDGKNYALVSMGGKGIGVVDLTNPGALTPAAYLRTMTVNYDPPVIEFVDGGGNRLTEDLDVQSNGPVNDLLVDDQDNEVAADDVLFIANGAFGIQKTKLSNLMAGADGGVLPIEESVWTLKYAGENPWGGPLSLKMHDNRLYAALGFLGIAIFDPTDLSLPRLGAYNLYADCSTREDWFGNPNPKTEPTLNLKPACNLTVLADPSFIDDDGMPTWEQAGAELKDKDSLDWYPWAMFDRYGKYYYNARTMDVQVVGAKTMAYIAYGLGGLVAVNVSDPENPVYEGYVPAAPAHGPDEPPINVDKKGILSHFGSGMLKEAGVMDVRVVKEGEDYRAYYTDHFAGLVVVSGADDPALHWKNSGGNYVEENDTDPRRFWPDYSFVTSYDMTPFPVGDEELPQFLVPGNNGYDAPVMLVTGEINGHGGALFMLPSANTSAGGVDLVESSGAGGVSFVDITNLESASFTVPVNLVSTNEVGAAEDPLVTQPIAIGHTEGVTVSGNFLYVADGPHGVSVWRIGDGRTPIDDIHLVANTLQSEYPTSEDGVQPTPHAFKVGFGDDLSKAYVMSQSLGMRRIDVSDVTGGVAQVGSPALLDATGGIYEHNTVNGSIGSTKVTGQDHAYGVTFYGKYAIVADGDNGLTVYDTTVTPDAIGSHVAANIGDSLGTTGKPPLGRASSVKLWTNPADSKVYAVVAAGAYGVSVVDMTAFLANGIAEDLGNDKLIKTFEPIKIEIEDGEEHVGAADGRSVDVHVVGDIAYFSYDSFGIVAYRMADLIQPLTQEQIDAGCEPTSMFIKETKVDCRPVAVGYFKLQFVPGNEDVSGGALYMTPQRFPGGRLLFYVAYGEAGVLKLDWSNVAAPTIMARKEVVGGAVATAINNGRVYVAAGGGGVSVFK